MGPMNIQSLLAPVALMLASCASLGGWNSWTSEEKVWVVEATGGA